MGPFQGRHHSFSHCPSNKKVYSHKPLFKHHPPTDPWCTNLHGQTLYNYYLLFQYYIVHYCYVAPVKLAFLVLSVLFCYYAVLFGLACCEPVMCAAECRLLQCCAARRSCVPAMPARQRPWNGPCPWLSPWGWGALSHSSQSQAHTAQLS